MLREMQPKEVMSALEEVKTRMSPEALQFFKERGARKAAAAAAAASALKVPTGHSTSSGSRLKGSSFPDGSASSSDGTYPNVLRTSKDVPSSAPRKADRDLKSAQGKGSSQLQTSTTPETVEEDVIVADPRLEARLRFGLHSQVMGVQPEPERTTRDQVKAPSLGG